MRSWKRRSAAMAAVAAMAIGASVLSGGSPASGADPLSVTINTTFPSPAGLLRLRTGAVDALVLERPGQSTQTLSLTSSNCALNQASNSLMTFTPNRNGTVGFVNDSIGVQMRGEGNGTPCGQINGTQQSLTLSVPLNGPVMNFAELDIEGKFGVEVRAQLKLAGSTVYDTNTDVVEGVNANLRFVGSDSGPDSGPSDNARWRLPRVGTETYFDTIVLSVVSPSAGAFSLEGGSDGTPPLADGLGTTLTTTDSLFNLVDIGDLLSCGDTADALGAGVPQASIELVQTEDCEATRYILETGLQNGTPFISFRKPDGTNVFRATFTWTVEEAEYPADPTMIAYDEVSPPEPLAYCGGTPTAPEPPPGDPWCLLTHTATYEGEDASGVRQMKIVETLYGEGDPFGYR